MPKNRLEQLSKALNVFSFFAIVLLVLFLFNIVYLSHTAKLILTLFSFITIYFSGFFRCLAVDDLPEREKLFYKTILLLFIFYIAVVVDFTLIDDSLGRNISNVLGWNTKSFASYLDSNFNLLPFETIKLFVNAYRNETLSFTPVFENLIGNFIILMPFSLFLPIVIKKAKSWYVFLSIIFIFSVLIELLQFVFLTGSTDIDDIILNVSGAIIAFAILKIKRIKKIFSIIMLGVFRFER